LIGFAEGRDTFRGPSPRTPTICGCGPVFGFCPVGPRPPDPRNWRYRSAISFPFGSASRPRPPMGGTGRLFGFWSEPLSPQLVVADWGPSSLLSGYGSALPAYREPC